MRQLIFILFIGGWGQSTWSSQFQPILVKVAIKKDLETSKGSHGQHFNTYALSGNKNCKVMVEGKRSGILKKGDTVTAILHSQENEIWEGTDGTGTTAFTFATTELAFRVLSTDRTEIESIFLNCTVPKKPLGFARAPKREIVRKIGSEFLTFESLAH